MARKSQRVAAVSAASTRHKRAASNSMPLGTKTGPKKQKATPTKSQYFKQSKHYLGDAEDEDLDSEELSSAQEEDSAFESEVDEATSEDDEDEYDSDAERKLSSASKIKSTGIPKASPAMRTKENELLRPGVKTGFGPGTEVVIKKPKARPAGKTPYRDDAIHPNTLLFLEDLKANNERQWLKMHDPEFRQAERDWHSFVTALTERLIEIDDSIPELPVKDLVFRIYRDVRFSPDKTPYKPHFSAAWSRTGRKSSGYAAYYVQVAPNNSFLGGGLWHPEADAIAAVRNDIDTNPQQLKRVLMEEPLRREFLSLATNEAKAVKAFVSSNSENALKTKPKGFDAAHRDIDLLRLRNYTIGRKLSDDEVTGSQFLARVSNLLTAMKPFITHLNATVRPDDEEDEEEDDEDGDDE